jgi:hypothetical protein
MEKVTNGGECCFERRADGLYLIWRQAEVGFVGLSRVKPGWAFSVSRLVRRTSVGFLKILALGELTSGRFQIGEILRACYGL